MRRDVQPCGFRPGPLRAGPPLETGRDTRLQKASCLEASRRHVTPLFVIDNPAERQQNERTTPHSDQARRVHRLRAGGMRRCARSRCSSTPSYSTRCQPAWTGFRVLRDVMSLAGDSSRCCALNLGDASGRDAVDRGNERSSTAHAAPPRGRTDQGGRRVLRKLNVDETLIDLIVDLGEVRDRVERVVCSGRRCTLLKREERVADFRLLAGSFPRKSERAGRRTRRAIRVATARRMRLFARDRHGRRSQTPSYGATESSGRKPRPTSGTLSGKRSSP